MAQDVVLRRKKLQYLVKNKIKKPIRRKKFKKRQKKCPKPLRCLTFYDRIDFSGACAPKKMFKR